MFRPNSLAFVLFAGGLLAFGPLTMEMFVPALPLVARAFAISPGAAQLTISVFLAGFALGQLVSGPLSDVFGRRPLLIAGLALLALASLACALAPDLETLVAARFVQALGASVGQVASRAVIRDRHDGSDTARMLAYATVIIALASAFSPVGGGYLAVALGWQAVFAAHALLALLFLALVWGAFRETLARAHGLRAQTAHTWRGIGRLVRDRTFLAYTSSVCFMFGTMFAFISAGAFVFVEDLGMAPENFGFVFTVISGLLALGSFLAGALARRFERRRLFLMAGVLVALGIGAMAALAAAGAAGIASLLVPLGVVGFAMGFVTALGLAGAMEPHPEVAGTASALVGFSQGAFSAATSALAGVLYDGTALSLFLPMAVLALGVPLSFVLIRPRARRIVPAQA